MVGENQNSAKPKNDGNKCRAEKLADRVRKIVTTVDTIERAAGIVNQIEKTLLEFILCVKGFDHAQAAECLVYLCENLRILLLPMLRSTLE